MSFHWCWNAQSSWDHCGQFIDSVLFALICSVQVQHEGNDHLETSQSWALKLTDRSGHLVTSTITITAVLSITQRHGWVSTVHCWSLPGYKQLLVSLQMIKPWLTKCLRFRLADNVFVGHVGLFPRLHSYNTDLYLLLLLRCLWPVSLWMPNAQVHFQQADNWASILQPRC